MSDVTETSTPDKDQSLAWNEGYSARENGYDVTSNPYSRFDKAQEREDWTEGWFHKDSLSDCSMFSEKYRHLSLVQPTCWFCRHYDVEKEFSAVMLPPNGQIVTEEQYSQLISSGHAQPGMKGVVRSKISMCRVFPKHEPVPSSHTCGQHMRRTRG